MTSCLRAISFMISVAHQPSLPIEGHTPTDKAFSLSSRTILVIISQRLLRRQKWEENVPGPHPETEKPTIIIFVHFHFGLKSHLN